MEMIRQNKPNLLENIGDYGEWLQKRTDEENAEEGSLKGIDCRKCKNKGYIVKVRENQQVMIMCECMGVRKSLEQIERSGLKSLLDECTFENYEATEQWQKHALSLAQNYLEYGDDKWLFFGGQSGCVDMDTEYFDGGKWVKISNYCGGNVLQYDPKTKKASLTEPKRYISVPSKKLYQINTIRGSIDQVLSEDHNFAYITSKGHMQKKPFHEVMELHNQNVQGFYGKIETAFNYSGEGIDLTDREIRLMCAVIADGSFTEKIKKCRVNLKKERKKIRMRQLLDGMDYKEYKKSNGYSVFVFCAPRREKKFTEYWYSCNQEQLKIVAEEVFFWDGRIDKKNRHAFYSTEKESADFVQFALASTGIRSTICTDERTDKKTCYSVIASCGNSTVSMVSTGGRTKATITDYTPKDGKQYCFEVETGYLVLRRNGRIFITGNSGKSMLCTAVAGELLKRNNAVKYMMWDSESKALKSLVNDTYEYEKRMDELKSVKVLYIDDFLKVQRGQQPTPADINLAFEIINHRDVKNLRTIISTEKTIDDIISLDEALGGRINRRSRGYQMNIAYDKNKNFRLRK